MGTTKKCSDYISVEWDCVLLNDGTRTLGNISRSTHVGVSYTCFQSLDKLIEPDYTDKSGD